VADRWDLTDLESALVDLGQHLEFPPTPDLASRVLVLGTAQQPRAWQRLLQTPLRLAFASVVVLLVALIGILAFSPEARTAVAERLGLRGAPVEQVSRLPNPTAGADLELGDRTTLPEAKTRLPLLLPGAPELGEPDAVYVAPTSLGGTVSVAYGSRPGLPTAPETGVSLLVLESRLPPAGFQTAVLGKGAGPGTRVEELSVNGGRGVWLEGAPHVLYLPDANGQINQDRARLAANVLLWEQNGLLMRLEGTLSRDQALQIAASVH
jgi:hypothetical protein